METKSNRFPKRVLSTMLAAAMAIPMMTATAFAVDRSQILTDKLPDAVKDVGYAVQVETTRDNPVWKSGRLPNGLTLDSSSGIISGTPIGSGEYDIQICDSVSSEAKLVHLSILDDTSDPVITTAEMDAATEGEPYRMVMNATGGDIRWEAKGFPEGLEINPITGVVKGTAKTSGDFFVKVSAKNEKNTASHEYTLRVESAPVNKNVPAIVSESLPDATVGERYKAVVETTGPKAVYWAAKGLPDGLNINADTGEISGIPTASGTYKVSVSALTTEGGSTAALDLLVRPAPGKYTVSAAIDEHGTISGKNPQEVIGGETSEALTFEAANGYRIASVTVNGEKVAVDVNTTTYTFAAISDIDKDYKIVVATEKAPSREEGLSIDNTTANPGEDLDDTNAGGTVKVGNKSDSDKVGFQADQHTVSFKPATGWEHDSTFDVVVVDKDLKTIGNFTVKIPSGTTNNIKVAGSSVSSQADWDAMFPDARLSVNGDTVTVRFATKTEDMPYQVKTSVRFIPTLTVKDTNGGDTSVSDLTVYGEAKSGRKISKITLTDPVTDRKVVITDLARRSNSKGEYFDRDTGDFAALLNTKIGGETAKVWVEGNIDLTKKNGYTTEIEMTLDELPIALEASITYADRTSDSDKNGSSGSGSSGNSSDIAMNGGSIKYDYDEKVFRVSDAGNLTIRNIVKKGTSSKAFSFTLDFPADADDEYRIRGAITGYVEDGDTITLYAGEQVTIFDLPEGTRYKVVEKDPGSKYTTSYTVSNGDDGKELDTGYFTIKDGKVTTVTFTNVGSETTTTTTPVVNNGNGKNNPHTGR